ncbi:efflux RND transporter permease subunit [Celeribacter baekdonensis]|jgi:HAE1 family hydrophobic/amphiphilic exporter-1/multidrug efflux pump|uniref:Efflux pump membrane transporter n=1 Tax=Celeribacter baekdonensis B30 TaxID=1208323 RepID=K2JDL3_9RHOB|nr:efflux RND transporter permease subunit [Celeribacter baekdonensis]EKE73158.1 hydrophobe/amphiphile efflux-1 (HAE1) family protein [Celeribacter baekdonensis B30]
MARFFIDRPVFAWVISILIMGIGALSIVTLPIAQYPQIAPPSVSIHATYPGASAETVANTVTQVIEQQMTGLDGMRYMSSSSTSSGSASITMTFETGIDPDIAQVQVQNKLAQATALLPEAVQRQGVTVQKSSAGFLMVIGLISEDGQLDQADLADYLNTNLVDAFSRIEGVGGTQIFGAQYAMRIWLDPSKLAAFDMTPSDVVSAISSQNAQISAGAFGSLPSPEGQALNATITAQSLLKTPEDFRNIILRSEGDGGIVLLQDVARVEVGAENYSTIAQYNGNPASGMAIQLAPGANALDTSKLVREKISEYAQYFPEGVSYVIPYDTTPFVEISIHEVQKTLMEAIVLVFFVMLLFLQNLRATLIPTLAVPVVLLGTFAILSMFGYSINVLTMLAMVLAIGLLVDDAIVVVENVERIMEEEGLSPREATRKSMDQITGALIGVALVLSAVFIPMAFFGGSTGVIYRQFSITIVSAMLLSVVVALTLTPALCATLLRGKDAHHTKRGPFGLFNRMFDKITGGYGATVGYTVRRPLRMLMIYAVMGGGIVWLFLQTPTGFLPDEDQGIMLALVQGPAGSTAENTAKANMQIQEYFLNAEKEAVDSIFTIVGFSFAGAGQNNGLAFVRLKDWEDRPSPAQSVQAIAGRAYGAFMGIQEAMAFPIVPPAVTELGNVSGFDFYLQAPGGQTHEQLLEARNMLLGMAAQSPLIASARPSGLEDATQFKLDIDWRAAGAMGVSPTNVGNTLSIAMAGTYVNDFDDNGKTKRVYVQGEADARATPTDLQKWRVRNSTGDLVAFSNFASERWVYGPQGLNRYNGIPAMQIQGSPAPGVSTGEAMAEIERLVGNLPPGFAVAWTGLSLEERDSGSQAPMLYALSLAAIFFCLAALYESWAIPFSVMLALPVGILGTLSTAYLFNFQNGVFFQVGMLTVIGLTGKNAILIVEFAREQYDAGANVIDAVLTAARQRFRPIIMTSLAFSLGVVPLVLSSGAGSGGRRAVGSAVLGGTISGTVFGIIFVPLFFVLVMKLFGRKKPAA